MTANNDNDLLPHLPHANTSLGSPATTIADILLILRREWRFPLLGCLIGLVAAAAYVISVPPRYYSTARILIDRSVNRFLQAKKILDVPAFDDAETGSQIYVLSSESIVLPIVRSMDLAHDPEFVSNIGYEDTQNWLGISKLKKIAKQLAGLEVELPIEMEAALERTAVETFLKRLNVSREDVAGVINVTFESRDSKKAARIVNTIVDSYIAATSDAKSRSAKMASQLLQDRLIELKQSVVDADKALQEFRMANNLVGKGDGLSPIEQIPTLTAVLTNAKMKLAEAKAQVSGIQERATNEEALGTIFPDNQVIMLLRSKYRDLFGKADELASRVGQDHTAVVKLRKEMNEVRAEIRAEEKRLAGFYVTAYQAARSQSNEVAAMVAQLSEEAKGQFPARSTMRELEGKADSLRVLYNNVLEQFNQLNTQPVNPIQDASIITRAAPQLHRSPSKSFAVLGGGVVFGLLFGAGGTVGRELAAGVFRTPEQVKRAIGIYCVSVPTVEANGKQVDALQPSANSTLSEELVLDAPYSRFAESFRNIRASLDAAQRVHGDKVIGVVSPVANNGKSTIVTNLATLMSASARTLVIDGDLHRRRLTARLEPDAREGLIEALDDPSRLAALASQRPSSRLHFLPCALSKRIPNAAELLGSPQMERLLIAARDSYDYIIVECAPVMSVVDVKMIERFVDKFVFVIEWGQTSRRVAEEALDEFDSTRERTLCVVLNKVDPKALRMIEAYKGSHYRAYYEA